jgi:hypothetical protein
MDMQVRNGSRCSQRWVLQSLLLGSALLAWGHGPGLIQAMESAADQLHRQLYEWLDSDGSISAADWIKQNQNADADIKSIAFSSADLAHTKRAERIAEMLPLLKQVKSVELIQGLPGASEASIAKLVRSFLKRIDTLSRLNLSESPNQIRGEVVTALVEVLPKLERVMLLILYANQISDADMGQIVTALPNNLVRLSLGGNSIGDLATQALRTRLPQLPRLKQLCIARQDMTPENLISLETTVNEINQNRQGNSRLRIEIEEPQQVMANQQHQPGHGGIGAENALEEMRNGIVKGYNDPNCAKVILKILPTPEEVAQPFNQAIKEWTQLIQHDLLLQPDIRKSSLEGLQLLSDDNILEETHHPISARASYQEFPWITGNAAFDIERAKFYREHKLPSIRQLVVVAHRLYQQLTAGPKLTAGPTSEWVQQWLSMKVMAPTQKEGTQQTQQQQQTEPLPSDRFFAMINALSLNSEPMHLNSKDSLQNFLLSQSGKAFVEAFMNPNHQFNTTQNKPIGALSKLQSEMLADWKKQYNSNADFARHLVQVAFHSIRHGHGGINDGEPACAEGAYLQIMKLIGELLALQEINALAKSFGGAKLGQCGN